MKKVFYNFSFFSLLFFFSFIQVSKAQSIVGKKALTLPKDYQYPTGEQTLGTLPKTSEGWTNAWIVFSDRANNPTYTTAGGGTEYKKMDFMDAFYVIDEKDLYVHIVKYELATKCFGEKKGNIVFTTSPEDFGWVHKDKMLIWSSCLTTPNRYSIKGLAINSIETVRDIEKHIQAISGEKLDLYDNPELSKKNNNDFRLFDFLYIFKKEGDSYLVGKINEIKPHHRNNAPNFVLGWVKKEVIKEWRQRLCLEPNFDLEAVNERKSKGIENNVFLNSGALEKFNTTCKVGNIEDVIWNQTVTERIRPIWKRLPILQDEINAINPNLIKTGIVTNIFDPNAQVMMKSDEYLIIEEKYYKLRESFRNVNIVFVVDGSELMKEFQLEIAKTISAVKDNLDKLNEAMQDDGLNGNKYRMGLVVYRDEAEKNTPKGEIQNRKLTDDYNEILDYFNKNVMMQTINDKSDYQSLYKGLGTALREFQGRENESNLIVLIGCGMNDPSDVSADALIKQLADYQVSVLACQVKSPPRAAYEGFPRQILNLTGKASDLISEKSTKLKPASTSTSSKSSRTMRGTKIPNVLKYKSPDIDPVPGMIMFSDASHSIDANMLNSFINTSMEEIIGMKEDLLNKMENFLKGQGEKVEMNEGMYAFLTKMEGGGVDIAKLKKISNSNLQLYVDGFLSLKCSGLKHDLYSYSVLMADNELSDLISNLNRAQTTGTTNEQNRINMQEAFKSIMSAYFGSKEIKAAMKSTSIGAFMSMVTGMPVKSKLFDKYTLEDITSDKKFNTNDFNNVSAEINRFLTELEEYRSNENNKFNSGDQRFYWLPQSIFP